MGRGNPTDLEGDVSRHVTEDISQEAHEELHERTKLPCKAETLQTPRLHGFQIRRRPIELSFPGLRFSYGCHQALQQLRAQEIRVVRCLIGGGETIDGRHRQEA